MPNVQFLATQVLAILGSVIGIYLAAYVSFKRTLERDDFIKAMQKSDLLTALREELKQNIARLRKFDERLPADSGHGVDQSEWPQLRVLVWQAAGRSSLVFDIPPLMLADLQALYGDLALMLNEKEAHQNFRTLTTSNVYDRTYFKKNLIAQLTFAETSILPALTSEIGACEQLTKKYGRRR
jgi:hypothetical protein